MLVPIADLKASIELFHREVIVTNPHFRNTSCSCCLHNGGMESNATQKDVNGAYKAFFPLHMPDQFNLYPTGQETLQRTQIVLLLFLLKCKIIAAGI